MTRFVFRFWCGLSNKKHFHTFSKKQSSFVKNFLTKAYLETVGSFLNPLDHCHIPGNYFYMECSISIDDLNHL